MLGSEAAKRGGKAQNGRKTGAKAPHVWPLVLWLTYCLSRSKKQQSRRELHEKVERRRESLPAKSKALFKIKTAAAG